MKADSFPTSKNTETSLSETELLHQETLMKRTWKLTTAGILDIISGVGFLGTAIFVVSTSGESPKGLILSLFWMPFTIVAVAGGICAFRRKMWRLALSGSISAALVGFVLIMPLASMILGIPAYILTKMSKEEFGQPTHTA